MAISDRWIVGCAVVVFVLLIVLEWAWEVPAPGIANTILAITAAILLWYTLETTRLRRDAEKRTVRDGEPLVYFEVIQLDRTLPSVVGSSGPTEMVGAGHPYPLRFQLINHSANSALARVRVRLKIADQIATFPESSPYGGAQVWDLTPFFRILGWFNLYELIARIQMAPGAGPWPTERMTLAAQVDLYRSDHALLSTVSKEYAVELDVQACVVNFWPEISARILPPVRAPDVLPPAQRVQRANGPV